MGGMGGSEEKKIMNTERLQAWADGLRGVPETRFNIERWIDGDPRDFEPIDSKCGTAACAAGWLPYLFPKEWGYDDVNDPVLVESIREKFVVCSFNEVAKWLDAKEEVAYWICCPSAYNMDADEVTPNIVADRLEELIAGSDEWREFRYE